MSTDALARRVHEGRPGGRRRCVGSGANGTSIRTRMVELTWSLDELRAHREHRAAEARRLAARIAALRSTCADAIAASDQARSVAASGLAEHQVLMDHLRAGLHDLTTP